MQGLEQGRVGLGVQGQQAGAQDFALLDGQAQTEGTLLERFESRVFILGDGEAVADQLGLLGFLVLDRRLGFLDRLFGLDGLGCGFRGARCGLCLLYTSDAADE